MARASRRYSRTPEAVEAARRWFAAEIEHERAHRSQLEARPREDFALDGHDPVARRRAMIHKTDERIAALQKLQRQLGRRKTVRIRYGSLHDLVRKADDAVLVDMFLGLEDILGKAVKQYPTERQLRDALKPDEWFEMRTLMLCHGNEDVFVHVPRPTAQVPASALRSDTEYIAALRMVYANHAIAVLSALAEDEVMEALFDDAPDAGSGPCKAAAIVLHLLAGLGVRTIFDIRQRMGLLSYSRPMPTRKRRDRDATTRS